MSTDVIFLIGRIIFGLYFLSQSANHFMNMQGMTAYAASKGVPMPNLAVAFTGLLLLMGAVTIGTGFQPMIGVAALVLFLIPVSFIMHRFWAISDPQQKAGEMVNFTKNMGLLGSVLIFTAIPQPWPLSLGG